ncbi:hypothetical protein WDU94_007625 [Cyamophila willieti]
MSSESLNPEQVLQILEEDDDGDISDDDNVEIQSEDDDSDEDPDYVPPRKTSWQLLSTMHNGSGINMETGKPEIIMVYNETKGAVDTFDQMCQNTNFGRKTRRWPMAFFYNILNIVAINAFVIYSHNILRAKQTPMNPQDFMMKLHEQLAIKWEKMCLEKSKTLNITTKLSLQKVTGDNPSASGGSAIKTGQRKYCNFCNYKKKRMTAVTCDKCEKFICGEHQIKFCRDCIPEN